MYEYVYMFVRTCVRMCVRIRVHAYMFVCMQTPNRETNKEQGDKEGRTMPVCSIRVNPVGLLNPAALDLRCCFLHAMFAERRRLASCVAYHRAFIHRIRTRSCFVHSRSPTGSGSEVVLLRRTSDPELLRRTCTRTSRRDPTCDANFFHSKFGSLLTAGGKSSAQSASSWSSRS